MNKKNDETWSHAKDWYLTLQDVAKRGRLTCGDSAANKAALLEKLYGPENGFLLSGLAINNKVSSITGHTVCLVRTSKNGSER